MTSSQAASPTFAALESLGESASEAGQPSPQRASLSESLDGSTHNGSTHEPPDGGHSELEQLQAALAAAQAQVRAMEAKVSMWEECMRTLVYCVMLSPEMNDIYKQECVDLLQNTLVGVEQVALEGWYHIQFSLMLRLDQLEVSGRMRFRAKPDFSSIVLSFASLPSFKLRAECTVSWGVVPLPIQEYLQTAVREQMKAWLVENMVAPNELEINPPSFQPKRDLTEDDVQKAIKAVSLARTYSALHEGPV